MRLTKKKEYGYMLEIKGVDTSIGQKAIIIGDTANKLGQLEDIEEKLGIDLLTLFKALTDTIAIKNKDESIEEMWACPRFQISIDKSDSWILYGSVEEQNYVSIKDYGKTWALTKEELK